jgi:adenylate cyclase
MEIERKFLVKGEFKSLASISYKVAQGYLSSVPERTVRIRIRGKRGFITVKGESNASGLSRYEWEKEIPLNDAQQLLKLCEPCKIEKTRYEVIFEHQTFEVDEFAGNNQGLVLAELELLTEDATFSKPDWLGEEVTGDERYYNAYLCKNPYSDWKSEELY